MPAKTHHEKHLDRKAMMEADLARRVRAGEITHLDLFARMATGEISSRLFRRLVAIINEAD